jgi:Amino acid synthesis
MQLEIRKWHTQFEEQIDPNNPQNPLVKLAIVAIVKNPFAGTYQDDLSNLIHSSTELGKQIGDRIQKLMTNYAIQSYGKAGICGIGGEQEHANALLTTTFANPVRDAVGGGKAWISSFTKIGGPGTSIDVPLAHKDALYVRSHYDGMTVTLHDGPLPNEIAIIFCVASRGRINARVGGLSVDQIQGKDGLI